VERWVVFSAAVEGIPAPVTSAGFTFARLTDEAIARLPADLKPEQVERRQRLGFNGAYEVRVDGAIAHISWLIPRSEDRRILPRVLKLRDGEAEITACLTLPEFRGRGIYPYAIRAIAREAGELGIRRLYMKTKTDNLASQRGIEKAGFERYGQVLHYHLPWARRVNLIWRTFRRAAQPAGRSDHVGLLH